MKFSVVGSLGTYVAYNNEPTTFPAVIIETASSKNCTQHASEAVYSQHISWATFVPYRVGILYTAVRLWDYSALPFKTTCNRNLCLSLWTLGPAARPLFLSAGSVAVASGLKCLDVRPRKAKGNLLW